MIFKSLKAIFLYYRNDLKSTVIIFLLTVLIFYASFNVKPTFVSKADTWYISPTPKSCNMNGVDAVAAGCQFYESCTNSFCQYNPNWSNDLTPVQALVIYDRLKTDVGIDIPLILDKDRISKLQDGGILIAGSDSPCASSFMFDTTGINTMGCLNNYNNNPDFQKAQNSITLHGILQATYPNLNDQDITILEQKVRAVAQEKAPGALLERTLLYIDVTTLPAIVNDVKTLSIKALNKSGELLPKVLDIAQSSKSFFFDKEGLAALRDVAASNGQRALDFTSQMQGYLGSVNPTLWVKGTAGKVSLWRSSLVLDQATKDLFTHKLSSIFPSIASRLGLAYNGESIYWTSDITRIVGQQGRHVAGVFIPRENVFAIDIKIIPKGIDYIGQVAAHEKIHYFLNQLGIRQYIFTRLPTFAERNFTHLEQYRAFDEGVTEFLNETFLNELGYRIRIGSQAYGEQVLAVQKLLGNGRYTEDFISAIRQGDLRIYLQKINWTEDMLRRWIANMPPIPLSEKEQDTVVTLNNQNSLSNRLFQPVYASDINNNQLTGNYSDDLLFNVSFTYVDKADETDINTGSYTLVNELSGLMDQNNLSEIPVDDQNTMRLLLLAGSMTNDVNNNQPTNLDLINNRIDDLNQIQETTYNPNEYNIDLPEIGNDQTPVPYISLTPAQINPTSFIPSPIPTSLLQTVNQNVNGNCDDQNWYCGGECACSSTRTLFQNTYPGQDAASIWRNERSQACGGSCSSSCLQSPTQGPGWPACSQNGQ